MLPVFLLLSACSFGSKDEAPAPEPSPTEPSSVEPSADMLGAKTDSAELTEPWSEPYVLLTSSRVVSSSSTQLVLETSEQGADGTLESLTMALTLDQFESGAITCSDTAPMTCNLTATAGDVEISAMAVEEGDTTRTELTWTVHTP